MRYPKNTHTSIIRVVAITAITAILAIALPTHSTDHNPSNPSYGNTMSTGYRAFRSIQLAVGPTFSTNPAVFLTATQSGSDSDVNLIRLHAELARLKKQKPKNAAEFRELQLAIQAHASRAMKNLNDPQSDDHLSFERDWLASSAHLVPTRASDRMPPSTAEQISQPQIMERWRDYASRREVLDLVDLRLMSQLGKTFEERCDPESAAKCYEVFLLTFTDAMKNNTDVGVRIKGDVKGSYQQLQTIFAGNVRRLRLVGSSMELTGKTFDGEEFNLVNYQGKVVLIDFWATWCGPCVAEYPQIRSLWEKYHAQGFEVVGVSMDADRESLAKYLREKEVPWIVLNDEADGGKHPSTEHYSIQTVPAMFLVGRDGKVITTKVEVAKLDELLKEAL